MDGPDVRLASVGDNVAFSVGGKLLRQGKWHTLANSVNISTPNVITITAIVGQLERVTFVGSISLLRGLRSPESVCLCVHYGPYEIRHINCIIAFMLDFISPPALDSADCVWVSNWLSHYFVFLLFFRFGLKWIRLRLRLHCRLTELNVLLDRQESHVSAYISTVSFAFSNRAPTQFELQLAAFGHG